MKKPTIGWQSWSPAFPTWHGFPHWDYSPLKISEKSSPYLPSKRDQVGVKYWCSWYAYGWNINSQKITHTLDLIREHQLPFTHILIDDGWTNWGDWHTPDLSRFKNLSASIAQIKSHNLQAGLWFAPFLASSKSSLFKNHPDWFIYHRNKPIQGLKTMPLWESFLPKQYLLDLDLPAVKKYLTDFIDLAINTWGVELLKLDFLYAPYFDPKLTSDKIPHNQVKWLLSYIKTTHPQIKTIACGTPFAPSLGVADIIRISKDTALPPLVPNLLNRIVYSSRLALLSRKLTAEDRPSHLIPDPDVRIFALDTKHTTKIWDTISLPVLGVGDNLSKLSPLQLQQMQLWLKNPQTQKKS